MPVTFRIPAPLRPFTAGRDCIRLEGCPATVAEALAELWAVCPGVRDRVLLEGGAVRPHVSLFVGTEDVRFTGGLATPLRDGSEIAILPAVSGGRAAEASTPPPGDTGRRSGPASLTSPSARGRGGGI